MKKILFIISFIAATSSTIAQSGYYHQVGDTVRGKCPIYHYENGWWPTLNATGHTDSLIGTIGTFGYMKHTTNTPLKVIGIASTWARLDRTTMQEDLDDSIDGSLYYVLLDATASGPVELTRVCWTDDYSTHPTRYMELPRRGGESCDIMQDYTAIVPLREYYFDSAITVTDSFYLGCVVPDIDASGPNAFNIFTYIASHMWDYCSYSSAEANGTYKECAIDLPEFTYYDSSALDNNWHHYTHKRFQLIFPIIELDTFCVTPEEPQVAYRDSLTVRVEWVDNSNISWEVSRTAPNGDPDAGLITPTTVPYIEYTDINNDSIYHVYVRGYCETGIWSGWSDWSTPCVIDSIPTPPAPPAGITSIETAELTISPNPTDGTVQILGLQGELTDIEVLDMTGRLLKTFEKTATFNISTLSSGIYIVRVKTHCDNTDKATYLKLVKK